MPSLAARPSLFAITVRYVLTSSAPLSSDARLLSLSRKSCRAALPCAFLARLAAHLDLAGKILRTDLCNRHSIRAPENRSTPELAACAAKTASAMSRSVSPEAIRITAPDHLAAIRAPGGSAFDDASPASDDPPASLHLMRRRRAPLESGASLARRSQPHAGPANRPLTPHVAPRVRLLPGFFGAPGSILPPSRQRERLVRSEAPSIDKCSLSRFRGGSPPPCPELCRSGPASGALSLLDMLSHERS